MDDLLNPVSTVTIRKKPDADPTISNQVGREREQNVLRVTSPEDALKILKAGPTSGELFIVLDYLKISQRRQDGFTIYVPEPKATQIVHVLVNDIVPSYWPTINERTTKKSRQTTPNALKTSLVECLRSLPGIGSLIARLKLLITGPLKDGTKKQAVDETLDVLQEVLSMYTLADDLQIGSLLYAQDQTKRTVYWKEVVNLRASGRIVATAAQAEDVIKDSRHAPSARWIANGSQYATSLGEQLGNALLIVIRDPKSWEAAGANRLLAQFTGKSLNMGYPNDFLRELLRSVCVSKVHGSEEVKSLVRNLRTHEQFQFVDTMLSVLTERQANDSVPAKDVSGAAGFLVAFVGLNESIYDHLVARLVQEGPKIYDDSIYALRVMLAVTTTDDERMQQVLEKSMRRFWDKLYIKHSPLLAQENLAQVLLLSAGYMHRKQPMFLFTMARSSIHNAGVSNRLAATSSRARFLGMVVGTAISDLVDKAGAKLKFDVDELKTDDAKWYQDLVLIEDEAGGSPQVSEFLESKWLKTVMPTATTDLALRSLPKAAQQVDRSQAVTDVSQTAIAKVEPSKIQVLGDDEEDEDLIPYAKPDSDPEDDDEDPTLVNRNRPTAPVYIRDLIASLRDTENHDRHVLALRTGPSLIRRKATFGKEVSDHAVELTTLFAGLGDHYELDDFAKLRLQSLVAILVAQPKDMGRWFAKAFFEGDYSISQRGAILSALGLGAREMADLENGDDLTGPAKEMSEAFPSKRLPDKFHQLYADHDDPVTRESKKLERGMMEPLALKAADKLSGPNALKVRTFSSRMDVEKKRKKPVSNQLGMIVADCFFFPLTGRFQMTLQAHGRKSIQSSPHLLPLYLRTLTLILHAAGPSCSSLPSMTSELFDLLLGLRGHAVQDENVLEALLFALLTVLDLNAGEDAATDGGRRLCTEMGREILEMQGWVEGVFERLNKKGAIGLPKVGPGKEQREEDRLTTLAAAVLTRISEIVGKFQRLLIGDMVAL
ncbi:MAG: telomere binding protein [Bathelium mastoideum]|nr:MAG: telomere binding protein [Bathelium mastoideum]